MSLLVEKKFKLIKKTYEEIERLAKQLHVTDGEVVDRMFLKFQPTDKEMARLMLCDYLMILTSKLSDEDVTEVMISQMLSWAFILSQTGKADIGEVLDYIKYSVEDAAKHPEKLTDFAVAEGQLKNYNDYRNKL